MKDHIQIIKTVEEKLKEWEDTHKASENKNITALSNMPWMKIIVASFAIVIAFVLIKKILVYFGVVGKRDPFFNEKMDALEWLRNEK